MPVEHLRFSPDILRRLGEELVPHVELGIVELVRNSYDADALSCKVELVGTDQPGGTIRVTDDGVGMILDAITSGWLVVGRSAKAGRQRTELGRLPVGDKGLGRLAALRMGPVAKLTTRPKQERGTEYCVTIEWPRFDTADVVESVPFDIETLTTKRGHGTTVEVQDIRVRLGRKEVQRLARALLLLADPFDDTVGFHPKLVASAFTDLEKRVRESYFHDAEYRICAEIDDNSLGQARVLDWKGNELWTAEHADLRGKKLSGKPYGAPPATFELWAFLLGSRAFAGRSATVGAVREWLDVVGGVHLYHRGLRVHPYGDPGHDWLEMNLRRARSPEERPSTNTSIGRVCVSDPDERLTQKTDRTGFVEGEAFGELRGFCTEVLDWAARKRLSAREEQRERAKMRASRTVSGAKEFVWKAIEQVPKKVRPNVVKAVDRLERARERESKTLREELQLYRTLATVGTTAAVFAHESAKPVTQIAKMADAVRKRGRRLLGDEYSTTLEQPVELIIRSADSLRSFAALPLSLLQREKRRIGRVEIHSVIEEVYALFEPFLTDASISVELQFVDTSPVLRGSVAAFEVIIANLLTNTVNAFNLADGQAPSRQVVIRTELSGEQVLLRVMDNGPGISGLDVDDIWLPGQTTVPGGTGLGLTIVRDSVVDLGGSVYALAHGELGGAEIVVQLPASGEPI